MFGLMYARTMELMNTHDLPFSEDKPVICVKCGKVGCKCGPECECNASFDKTLPPQKELIQDFE